MRKSEQIDSVGANTHVKGGGELMGKLIKMASMTKELHILVKSKKRVLVLHLFEKEH